MPILLIINGYPGSGKTTIANQFAQKNNFALINQDIFLFQLNAFFKNKIINHQEHIITIENIHDCLLNYMHFKKNIVLEGALVSISNKDPIDLNYFIKLAKKMKYKVVIVTLIAKEKIRVKRQKKRNYVLPRDIDKKICQAVSEVDKKIDNEIIIDSSNYSIKTTLQKLDQIISEFN